MLSKLLFGKMFSATFVLAREGFWHEGFIKMFYKFLFSQLLLIIFTVKSDAFNHISDNSIDFSEFYVFFAARAFFVSGGVVMAR